MNKKKPCRDEIYHKIRHDADFINSPKHDYSLTKFEKANPGGVSDRFAAVLLDMPLEEFQKLYKSIIEKYRQNLRK